MYKINVIAAVDDCYGIGKNGGIPWYDSKDLTFFKTMTKGNIVIMGRRTWKSLGKFNRPLEGRDNFVVSSSSANVFCETVTKLSNDWKLRVCTTPKNALAEAIHQSLSTKQTIWVIGGRSVYLELIPFSQRIFLSCKPGNFGCDTFFPSELLSNFYLYASEPLAGSDITIRTFTTIEDCGYGQ